AWRGTQRPCLSRWPYRARSPGRPGGRAGSLRPGRRRPRRPSPRSPYSCRSTRSPCRRSQPYSLLVSLHTTGKNGPAAQPRVDVVAISAYDCPLLWGRMNRSRWRETFVLLLLGVLWGVPRVTHAEPPAQRLPSALLVFPYIEGGGGTDTRVELVNLTGAPQLL